MCPHAPSSPISALQLEDGLLAACLRMSGSVAYMRILLELGSSSRYQNLSFTHSFYNENLRKPWSVPHSNRPANITASPPVQPYDCSSFPTFLSPNCAWARVRMYQVEGAPNPVPAISKHTDRGSTHEIITYLSSLKTHLDALDASDMDLWKCNLCDSQISLQDALLMLAALHVSDIATLLNPTTEPPSLIFSGSSPNSQTPQKARALLAIVQVGKGSVQDL